MRTFGTCRLALHEALRQLPWTRVEERERRCDDVVIQSDLVSVCALASGEDATLQAARRAAAEVRKRLPVGPVTYVTARPGPGEREYEFATGRGVSGIAVPVYGGGYRLRVVVARPSIAEWATWWATHGTRLDA